MLAAEAVSETPAVELVDAAAAVVAALQVAMVLTPRQPDLGPSPMVLAPPRVSQAASQFQGGLYPPALGQSSMGPPPGVPPVESLCSSSPS